MKQRYVLLAIASGALTALSFPGFELDFLVWFSLVPLFFALESTNPKQSFWLSSLAGLVFFAILLYWVLVLWEWAPFLILPGYLLLIAYLSLYWGAFGALYSFLRRRLGRKSLFFVAPALWIVFEFIKAQGPLGFTWSDLGYALYRRPELIGLASVVGVWGISFALVLVNSLLALGAQRLARHGRYAALYALLACTVLALLWGASMLLWKEPVGRELRVAVVQSEVSQRVKGDPTYIDEVLAGYQGLLSGIEREVDLVVMPESITLAGFPLQRRELLEPFREFARERRAYVLLGLVDHRASRYYNSAALLSPAGEVVGVYDKVHLVPFGEYIPLRGFLERLGLLGWIEEAIPGDFTPGKAFSPIESNLGRLASPISFESIFPAISRAFAKNGAQLLAAVTNEAWYKGSFALPQHFAMGVLRAVENRRFFIQSSNAGLSGIISPRGQILARSPWQKAAVVYGTVSLQDEITLYTRYGDWPVYLSALLVIYKFTSLQVRKFSIIKSRQ